VEAYRSTGYSRPPSSFLICYAHVVVLISLCSGTDNTRRGHVIGTAQVRVPAPERQMTAASTSVVRLLLHMSMYLGASESPQVSVIPIELNLHLL